MKIKNIQRPKRKKKKQNNWNGMSPECIFKEISNRFHGFEFIVGDLVSELLIVCFAKHD